MIRWAFLLLAWPAAAQTPAPWPVEQYDPGAAAHPADLVLPMPCGGAMAFQRVVVPVSPADPLDDRRLRLGQSQPETGYADYLHTEHLRGAFAAPEGSMFYIGRYEVTRAQLKAMAGDCAPPGRMDRTAAAGLSWFDAVDFTRRYTEWLRGQAGALPPETGGLGYLRLPTETEWEYAARGGAVVDATDFPARRFFGDADPGEYAMYQGAGSARGQVLPVGLRKPNPLGLYDVYGNAEEMMLEPFRLNVVGRAHGQAGGMVTRGGSVLSVPDDLYSAQRREYPLYRAEDGQALAAATFGMRLVLSRPVAGTDAELRTIRDAWGALAAAPSDTGDPLAALAAMIEDETDPRRQTALTDLQHEIRLSREEAAAAMREAARSTLLSGAVFIGAIRSGTEEIARQTGNVRAMADQVRLATQAQRETLMTAARRLTVQLETLRGLQRTYLLSYRGALEALSRELDPAAVAPALALLKQDLSQAGQVGLLNDLTGFEADLAAYAAQPDMSEGALEALALAR